MRTHLSHRMFLRLHSVRNQFHTIKTEDRRNGVRGRTWDAPVQLSVGRWLSASLSLMYKREPKTRLTRVRQHANGIYPPSLRIACTVRSYTTANCVESKNETMRTHPSHRIFLRSHPVRNQFHTTETEGTDGMGHAGEHGTHQCSSAHVGASSWVARYRPQHPARHRTPRTTSGTLLVPYPILAAMRARTSRRTLTGRSRWGAGGTDAVCGCSAAGGRQRVAASWILVVF
jgi:hypothetical protein